MSDKKGVTPRLRYWSEHLQTCAARGMTLSAYAAAEGLKVGALYEAKSRLKQRGLWPLPGARFVRVLPGRSSAAGAASAPLCRVTLPNGVVVETAGGDLATVLQAAAQLR